MATREITLETIETTINESGIVLLDFWAAWCGPCRMFGPVFEKSSEEHPDIVFGKIDTEAQQQLAAGFRDFAEDIGTESVVGSGAGMMNVYRVAVVSGGSFGKRRSGD